MTKIFWLASYPKSGNTWMRAVLENLGVGNPVDGADINRFGAVVAAGGASRRLFDELAGGGSGDLDEDEIDRLRPAVYEALAAAEPRPVLLKIHDAWTINAAGRPVFPPNATAGAVYILRNPLDVAVSFAHHYGVDLDTAVARMGDPEHALARTRDDRGPGLQLRQRLGSWSDHVRSWTEQATVPVHVVRYEDMHADPETVFAGAAAFLGFDPDPDAVRRAVQMSSFAKLRAQEDAHGFREIVTQGARFFREGRSGGWRDRLDRRHVAALTADHGPLMQRFGYFAEAVAWLEDARRGRP